MVVATVCIPISRVFEFICNNINSDSIDICIVVWDAFVCLTLDDRIELHMHHLDSTLI